MALNFPNVTLLGLSQESRFFDAGFNYSNSKRLTVNGLVTDLINSFGISGIWTGEQGILNTIKNNNNFDSLVLNSANFGTGRILNFSFEPGNDVRTKNYTVELEVFETGNLFNFTGNYYTGINTSNWQFLQDFSEDYSFDKKQNGGYSYNHNATIRFNSGLGGLNAIETSKTLARSLFTGTALGFAFYSGFTTKQGRRIFNESYNLIDNTCNFTENFDFDVNSGDYSVLRTNQFELGEDGIINITENADIRGIVRPTFQSAVDALNVELSGAYPRCSGLFDLYAPANSSPLIASPLTQNRSFDIFQNNLGYSVTFSNNQSNSGLYFWNYTQQVSYDQGIARLTEDGQIQGRGANREISFQNAKTGFNLVKNTATSRATQFYIDNVGSPTANFLESKNESYSPYNGLIGYTYQFSNEVIFTGTSGIKRIDFQVSDSNPVYLYGKFGIINEKEVIQDENNGTEGAKSLTLSLIGERSVPLSTYLENAVGIINENLPSGAADSFISDANYSYRPNENIVDVNVSWLYNKAVAKTISLNA